MLDNTKVKISNILSSLIPDFIEADNPKFKEFLEQYYIFEEREYGTTDIADDLSEYKNIAKLSEIETVRAQTIPTPGTLVPPQVVALTTNVLSFDDTINVTHTKGFPDTYGLLKIDDEIITYTGKTATSFTGCARGFSGISAIETEGNPEFLTFSETESVEHNAATVVLNLGFVFIGQFYSKFKGQFLPGVESRPFAPGLSVENILTRAKDFYTSKGTDSSIDLLFKVLYAKDVVIDKPFNNTISVSDAEWRGMCRALGREDLIDDERFSDSSSRMVNAQERKELTGEEISKWNSDDLLERFQKEGVPCAPLLDRMELMDHEQITANETIWYDNFDGFGQIRQARPAARFSETESEIVRPAPKLGEHGLEILSDLGYEKSLQQRLIDEGKLVVKND